jgi:uncharacterized membrane protein YkgB
MSGSGRINVRSLKETYGRLDERTVRFMATNGVRMLRLALGVVFTWFGLLKVIGQSPVADLVADTVFWVPPEYFVPLLGVWETAIGLGLFFSLALRLTLLLLWIQMIGTFSVLVVQPDVAFQGGNPLLLTTEGEFVIKNLVLIAGGLVVGSTVRRRHRSGTQAR